MPFVVSVHGVRGGALMAKGVPLETLIPDPRREAGGAPGLRLGSLFCSLAQPHFPLWGAAVAAGGQLMPRGEGRAGQGAVGCPWSDRQKPPCVGRRVVTGEMPQAPL